jgi:hypothetical protein
VQAAVCTSVQVRLQAFIPLLTEHVDRQVANLVGSSRRLREKSNFQRGQRHDTEDAYDGDTKLPPEKPRVKKNPQENAFHVGHSCFSQV